MLFSAGCIITQASLTINAQVRDRVLGDSPCQNASKCAAHLYMKQSRQRQMTTDVAVHCVHCATSQTRSKMSLCV